MNNSEDISYYDYINGNKLVGISVRETKEIYVIDLENNNQTFIGESISSPQFLDGNLLYQSEEGYYSYNLEKGTGQKLIDDTIEGFYSIKDAGEYIYGVVSDPETGVGRHAFILKEDFYKGKPKYIELEQ